MIVSENMIIGKKNQNYKYDQVIDILIYFPNGESHNDNKTHETTLNKMSR